MSRVEDVWTSRSAHPVVEPLREVVVQRGEDGDREEVRQRAHDAPVPDQGTPRLKPAQQGPRERRASEAHALKVLLPSEGGLDTG